LNHRYVHAPPVPDDLAASVPRCDWRRFTFLLAPAADEDDVDDDDDKEERAPFSVISTAMESENKKRVVAFVFCSGNGKWWCIAYPYLPLVAHRCSFAHGCFYWTVASSMGYSLVLDTREMKFSTIDLRPPFLCRSERAIADTGEGMLGLLVFDNMAVDLYRKIWRNNGGVGAEEWQLCKTSNLWCSWQYHTLELKTLILERLGVSNRPVFSSHVYARFPPLLAPPSL
ncbi:hypothetical protein BAE44_0007280, partial [Dichanthelium oligosanthes]